MAHRLARLALLALTPFLFMLPLAVRANDDPAWVGAIERRPAGGVSGEWVIGGRLFTADAATQVDEEHGPLATGDCAEVAFYSDAGGGNIATKIERTEGYRCGDGGDEGDSLQVYGLLAAFPADLIGDWTVGGATYVATATTRFDQGDGAFSVGGCVEVKFTTAAGVNTAHEIESKPAYKCQGGGQHSQVYGALEQLPASLIGDWVVDGVTYTATAATRFEQERGPFLVGGCVDVKYGAGNSAIEISTTEPYHCSAGGSPITQKLYGLIELIPSGNLGVWHIGGGEFTAAAATQLKQEEGPFAVGACASVEYVTQGGTQIATAIEVEDRYRCGTSNYNSTAYALIESLPQARYGTWQIGGVSYEADAATRFEDQGRPFAVGDCVKVAYSFASGVHLAAQIEREDADRCGAPGQPPTYGATQKVYAPIDSFPASPYLGVWGIGGVSYTAQAGTTFEQERGAFAVGACIEAKYTVVEGVNQLSAVETKPATRCQAGDPATFRAYGTLEVFPTGFGAGTWQIGGVSYQSTVDTRIEQPYGMFSVGAYVEVTYRVEGGARIAASIETHVEPRAGRVSVVGALEGRPSDDTGSWVIGGTTYQADPAIEVSLIPPSRAARLAAAPTVIANVYRGIDGTLRITSIAAVQQLYLPLILR